VIHPARLLSAWRELLSQRLGHESPQNLSLKAKSKAEAVSIAKASAQTREETHDQPAEPEQDALLPLLASDTPETVGKLLGVYAQAPQSTSSDSDDDAAGLITSPNTSPTFGSNVGSTAGSISSPNVGLNAVTSSQFTGSAAFAPLLFSPGLGVVGASAALLALDSTNSNSQTAPEPDTTSPNFTSGASLQVSVAESITTTTVVHTAAATDNVGVTAYAFESGGADNAKFSLNTATGALTFLTPPDFEAPASAAGTNTYTVKVKAVDAAGNSAVQTISITVTDLDDTAPVFTAGDKASITLAENNPSTTVVHTAAATDNVGITAYAFESGGADNNKFSLDTATGALKFISSPDFEAPASAAGTNAYSVKVKALDAAGNSAVQTVTVNVTDADDTAPMFTAGDKASITLAENLSTTTVVHTASATDNVGVSAYAFESGGPDNAKFSLDTATGALTFLSSPNYEAPASAQGNSTYVVKVKALDAAGNSAVQTVTVIVTDEDETPDVDDAAPVFAAGASASASLAENAPTTTVVHTASATDNVGVTAYAFDSGGADNNKFTLNTFTGALTFTNSPDFDAPGSAAGTNTYSVKVKAVDAAGNSAVQTITVTVTDTDDAAPVFALGASASATFAENTATTTVVHTASATDNVGVTAYAFEASGADNNKFNINAATGALTFVSSPDFETPASAAGSNTYSVKVKAVDAAGNSATQTVTVTVTNHPADDPVVDDTAPVFAAGASANASLAENTPSSTVVHTATASDNVGVTAYAFEASGADNSRFNLNSATGALTFISSPNFEAPGSAAGNNTYTVRVRASDAAGNAAVQNITVNVTDLDEVAPVFAQGALTSATVTENTPNTTVVHTASATDNVGVTAYAFESGGADNNKFSLNTATGALTFLSSPDFDVPGSAAGTNAYTVRVRASDAAGNSAVQTTTVNVTDLDEVAPVFAAGPTPTANVVENTPTSTVVHTASATDNVGVTAYAFEAGGADNNKFNLNTTTGALTFLSSPDLEAPGSAAGSNTYTVRVRASDAAGNSAVQTVTITVIDQDEVPPTFTAGASTSVTLAENTPTATVVHTATASDNVGVTAYAFESGGADNNKFNLNTATGALRFLSSPDFEAIGSAAGTNSYNVRVRASDAAGNNAVQTITVNVTDLDEVAPVFTAGNSTSVSIAENTPASTVVHTATASDNVAVSAYAFESGGADNNKFTINTATGALTFISSPNFEAPGSAAGSNTYTVRVRASDAAGNSAVQTITVNVTDLDEVAPIFATGPTPTANVVENTPTTTVIHTASATDNVGVTAYAFEAGGADNNKFNLNTATGALTFLSSPDIEAPGSAAGSNTYTVRVRASDAAGNSAVQTVTITVIDQDEVSPTFTAGASTSVTLAENTPTATVVHTAAATDNVGVTAYAFEAGGADNNKFNLNTATGALRFLSSPDFEAMGSAAGTNAYTVRVRASDEAGNTAVQTVTVNVMDLDEVAPVFTAGTSTSASIAENTPTTTVVHTATASDNVAVSAYAFEAGGADNNKFSLNTATGALTFISSPNFEAPGSAAGTNAYTVRVRASDAAGNSAVQTITVNVTDLDEVAPTFAAGASANASIAENSPASTVVHTASAIDNVGVTAYAFEAGGADNNKFNLNTDTGALTFLSSPDIEAPGSAAGSNTYTVRVRASDAAGNSAVQTVTITVIDQDEVPPTFTAGPTPVASVSENSPTSTVVHTASATDNVGVTAYAFESGGADNNKFNLNTATGALTFISSPNFEAPGSAAGTNAYTVRVRASDAAGNTAVQTITVNVTDLDEVAPVFSQGALTTATVVENTPATTVVHTASATDNVGVTGYSFESGGADNNKFTINTATGALTFISSPDFDVPGSAAGTNAYNVKVKAVDSAGNSAVQAITVTVTDVDEVAPVFAAGANTSTTVSENSPADTVVHTATATDNVGVTAYAFESGGADNNKFNLNTSTGALTFISSPNFEAPGSAAGTNVYTVRVRASDAAGNNAVQTITVNVTDLDEVAPIFAAGPTPTANVLENTPTSTVVHTATATDNVGVTAYAFEAGGADNNKFSLNTATGALTFLSSPDIEAPGSAAGTNTYNVKVRASDAAGNSAVQTVSITVIDQDEVPPTFTAGASTSVTLAENTPTSTVVHTATATDNVGVTAYAFDASGADNNKFSLNSTTGALTFISSPDFEALGSAAGTNAYTVRVRASDAAGNSAVQTITVNVTDLDEVAPTFAAGLTATASIAENAITLTVVHTATATDNVGVTAYAFEVGGADNNKFNLNTATGALTFLSSPNFEAPGSAAGSNTYTIKVRASDAAGNSAVQTVTVNVTDVDDTSPVFAAGANTSASIAENTPTSTVVHTATATDNVGVTAYAFEAGGADNNKFSLNTITGALSFLNSPNFEAPGSAAGSNTYTVRVRASDAAGNSAVQTVTVNVTDVDDTAPVFAAGATTSANIAENSPTATVVHTATATDNVGVTAYAFESGGADNNKFTINATTGALTFISSPNFEAPGSAAGTNAYTVRVRASDAAGNSAVQTVTVNVTDVDDTAPVFTAGATTSASIAENTPNTTVVHTSTATDNVGVTAYAFEAGGADNNKFSLNTSTGALTFLSSPNFEAPGSAAGSNTYTVRVRASDAAGNSAVQTVTVNVTDVDDTAPVFAAGASSSASIAENTPNTTVVHTATATDNVGVTAYAFETGGADNNKFSLNTATGALTFIASPNFEAPGSAAGTNIYNVRVRASDAAGNTAVQTITVNVTDVDDTAPVFAAGTSTSASIAENTSTSTVVHTATATDNVGVTAYAFESGGADNNKFNINATTGALTFISSPNFEAPGSAAGSNTYTVRVRASDAAGNNAVQTVTVTVTDVDDTAPVFTAGANTSANIAENTSTATVVHTATATDNVGVTVYAFETGGADNNRFTINATTGALTFLSSPNFEAPGSAAGSNTYTVRVRASDAAGNSAVQTITVNVTDVDDTAPVFTAGASTSASIAENTPTTTVVHTATATDNVGVTAYAFEAGGADNNRFTINATTGALRFLSSPNFEAPGSAAGSNTYTVRVRASDAAGNNSVQTVTVNVIDVDDTAPVFTAGASTSANIAENTLTSTVVHTASATDNVGVTAYAFEAGGADNNKFSLNTSTGALTFISRPDFEAPGSAAGNNTYNVRVRASDAAGNNSVQTVAINVTDVFDAPTTSQAFTLWQEAELAWLGDSSKNINALNQYSAATMQHRDITSADGSANQADPAKRLSQYINQVTGTDIVSDAEFDAGFTITGKANAGAQATIKFRLDKDRTTGVDGQGAQVLNLGANDVDNLDGDNNNATGTDVTATYNNATGDWSLAFAPGSGALLQATHNTHGSGVHQLLVDTDGNGSRTGSGASAEASRLFLVASGTANSSHTGLVSQNFSVQDKLSNDVFVYYFGDPDGVGVSMWTQLDNGDSASNPGINTIDRDIDTPGNGDIDYYNNPTANANAASTPATASNTALHLVTNIAAQTWEFHMGTNGSRVTWSAANAQATDHGLWGSNTSRLASLAEMVALYAANFGGNNEGGNTVDALQPTTNVNSINGHVADENNPPGGWLPLLWTAAPTPSGYARLNFGFGHFVDLPDTTLNDVSAVL
jgi:hypothetical protein